MGDACEKLYPDMDAFYDDCGNSIDESISVDEFRLIARPVGNHLAQHAPHGDEMRDFLVACHQASVSVETMSKCLGHDADTIRSELLRGIEAWNAAQRRTSEAAVKAHLRVAAFHD